MTPWNPDRTGAEALENRVFLLDAFEHAGDVWDEVRRRYRRSHPDFRNADRLGPIMAECWFAKLTRDFPSHRFRVYFARTDSPNLRFHRVYDDEPLWLYERDWSREISRGRIVIWDSLRQPEDSQ